MLKSAKLVASLRNNPVVKNFLIYCSGSFLLRVVSALIVPLNMQLLTPADYGLLNLITSFVNVLAIFIGLGLRQAFFLDYFHCSSIQRRAMAREVIVLYLLVAVPVLVLLVANISVLNEYLFLATAPNTLIMLSLLYCFLIFFAELFYQILQYQTKAVQLTLLQTGIAALTVGLNLIFLWHMGYGIYSSIIAQTIGLIVVCAIGVQQFYVRQCHKSSTCTPFSFNVKHHVRQGLLFIPGMLCAWIVASSDRLILAQYATLHDVGIYSVADMFCQLFQSLVLLPFGSSYLPILFQRYAANKDTILSVEEKNQRIMWVALVAIGGTISFGYWSCKGLLYWFLPTKYHEAIQYVWLLVFGYVFLMGTYFVTALLQFKKKKLFLVFSLILPAGLNIILNFVLIPRYKITGCVLATTIAYGFYFVSMLLYNYRVQRQIKLTQPLKEHQELYE